MNLFFITFICLILPNWVIVQDGMTTKTHNTSTTLTFIANSETMGNCSEASTMDYFQGIQYPHLSLIISELDKTNQKIEVVDWQDRSIDWSTKDKLILGPVWGYTKNIDAFMTWLNLLENKQADMINSPKFLKWNVNKHYLLDLQKGNITIPHSLIIEPGSNLTFDEAKVLFHKQFGDSDIILKGVIDAGAFGYRHVQSDALVKARIHFEELKAKNGGVIIQNFIPQIYKKGEFAFVFFDDKMSHFFLKLPKYNEERVQPFYGGKSFHFTKHKISNQIGLIKSHFRGDLELDESEVRKAYTQAELVYVKLLSILDDLDIPHPKYLRIDGVMIDTEFVVMELEGIEPYLEMKEAMVNDPANNVVNSYLESLLKVTK